MAQEIVGIKIVVDGQEKILTSMKDIRAELKKAQSDAIIFSEAFGSTSKQATDAAQRVAKLKDAIGDAKNLTDAYNPDAKFKAFGQALQGVVGSITAVQGAIGLLGVKNEAVEQTLLRVQSAMALSQGLDSVFESIEAFKNLGNKLGLVTAAQKVYGVVMKATTAATRALNLSTQATTTSMRIMRGVMATLGIGALIAGITFLITKISDWTSSTDDNEAAQKALNDTIEQQNKLLEDNINGISNATKMQVLRAKEAGKSGKEIHDIEIKGLQDEAKALKNSYNERLKYEETPEFRKLKLEDKKKYYDETAKINQQYADKNTQIALSEQEFLTSTAEQNREKNKKLIADNEATKKEELQKRKEAAQQLRDLENENFLNTIRDENQRSIVRVTQEYEKAKEEIIAKKFTKEEEYRILLELRKKFDADIVNLTNENAKKLEEKESEIKLKRFEKLQQDSQEEFNRYKKSIEDKQKFNEIELEATQKLQEEKVRAVNAGLDLIGALAGKNEAIANVIFTIEKAIEIGKIVTSTTAAIAKLKAANGAITPTLPPYGLPNPGYAYAKGLEVKQIAGLKIGAAASIASIAASTISKFKSGAGGGLGATANVGAGGGAPITPPQVQATLTQLDQGSINRLGSATGRAYVVETDITNSQERIRRINRAARLN